MTPGVSAEEEAGEEDHRDDEYNPRNNSDPRQNLADPGPPDDLHPGHTGQFPAHHFGVGQRFPA
jgi:hypothetical protein